MASIAVSSSLGPGHVVVVPRGELDVTGATRFARALPVAAVSGSRVIVDLAGLAALEHRHQCATGGYLIGRAKSR